MAALNPIENLELQKLFGRRLAQWAKYGPIEYGTIDSLYILWTKFELFEQLTTITLEDMQEMSDAEFADLLIEIEQIRPLVNHKRYRLEAIGGHKQVSYAFTQRMYFLHLTGAINWGPYPVFDLAARKECYVQRGDKYFILRTKESGHANAIESDASELHWRSVKFEDLPTTEQQWELRWQSGTYHDDPPS